MTKANEKANDFFNDLKQNLSAGVNVCKLGKVVKFYPETMKADVMPLPSEDNAMVLNVPVATVRSKDYVIYYPLEVDDYVVLLFADNDTDDLLMGQDSSPTERGHDVSDCICIGGITLLNASLSIADTSSLCLQNIGNSASISLSKDGEVNIKAAKVKVESPDIELVGFAKYKGREIAVKGDADTRGDTLV